MPRKTQTPGGMPPAETDENKKTEGAVDGIASPNASDNGVTEGAAGDNSQQNQTDASGNDQLPAKFQAPQSQEELDALVAEGVKDQLSSNESVQGLIAAEVARQMAKKMPRVQPKSTDVKLPTHSEAVEQLERTGSKRSILSDEGYVTAKPPAERSHQIL